ncbi:MAG TPA: aminopeptidase [Chthoniobacterales bacterium]|jgi:leucyl aminopeptidase (aminopeptidase T)|nr:aminopeptidase [Chthoniobacterales bacterium]
MSGEFFSSIDNVQLDKLAEVVVRVGLRLQAGQDLFLTAPVAALPLVRRIAEHAYKGGNKSLIHIDWMVGSAEIDIDGLHTDGRREPVFRKGEWVRG